MPRRVLVAVLLACCLSGCHQLVTAAAGWSRPVAGDSSCERPEGCPSGR